MLGHCFFWFTPASNMTSYQMLGAYKVYMGIHLGAHMLGPKRIKFFKSSPASNMTSY